MPKSHCFVYLLLISLPAIFFACNNDFENYSVNPQHTLTFSTDTLAFDTVLTTVNSPLRYFKVYNRNSKPLLISSVTLAAGTDSNYKINVDGFAGLTFENIEIGANDSIYVLVDIKPVETGQFTPALLNDYVVFTTNNVRQEVVLSAYGQDVFTWKGITLTSDSLLDNQKPYLIYDSLVVETGARLTINEGAVFYMHNNAQLIVRGTVIVKGSLEHPVVFRGSRTDDIVNIPYDRIPGQWGGICFAPDSYENVFENVHIRNGKFGMDFALSEPTRNKIIMKNVVLTNVSGTLLNAVNCDIVAENCEFSNARYALLNLTGGSYRFTHCTLANFYPVAPDAGWLNSDNETLILADTYYPESGEEEKYFPILSATFSNTIIWGAKLTSGIKIEQDPASEIHYIFSNCLLPNEGSNDDHFIACIFRKDPLFTDNAFLDEAKDKNERNVYATFDFSLQEKSPARDIADPDIARTVPYDIKGFYRFTDGQPDLGAYEYKTENK
ncbi:MAG: hypothetical protein LBT25_00115 [Candidatus Symbiothrix sp.]|jgi:hypothetical protein|nr:hypothetical protein [Candidatus Symbiothrix sp.]